MERASTWGIRKRITRRGFLKTVGAAAAALSVPRTAAAKGGSVPNVIYVFSDTHRWCSMSFTETPGVRTPNMAEMKRRGVSFDHCYSTLAICTPYRAILQTGRWPWQQGLVANHMSITDRVDGGGTRGAIAWMFKDAGYATHYVGKWHLGKGKPVELGFDTAAWWNLERHDILTYRGTGDASPFAGRGDWSRDARYSGIPAHPPHPAYPKFPHKITGETDQALILMERHDFAQPLFLMLSLHDPHGPHSRNGKPTYPPHLQDRYKDARGLEFRPNDRLRQQAWRRDYHASVNAVDDELGRIRAKLAELGVADNTILIYSSDHGGMGGAQGVGNGIKRWPHDESTRLPFLVEWPGGIPAGKRNRSTDALMSSIDIFPTVCGLAGLPRRLAERDTARARESLEYLGACPGVDLSKNVLGLPGAPDPESVFLCHPSNMNSKSPACPITRTVVTKRHFYSVKDRTRLGNREKWMGWDTDGVGEWCLYDRVEDPFQMRNLASSPETAPLREDLRRKLDAWLATAERPFVRRPKVSCGFSPVNACGRSVVMWTPTGPVAPSPAEQLLSKYRPNHPEERTVSESAAVSQISPERKWLRLGFGYPTFWTTES